MNDLQKAYALGKKAFANGIKAPVHDKEFIRLLNIFSHGKPVGTSIPLLQQWQRGHAHANLDAPIPEEIAKWNTQKKN